MCITRWSISTWKNTNVFLPCNLLCGHKPVNQNLSDKFIALSTNLLTGFRSILCSQGLVINTRWQIERTSKRINIFRSGNLKKDKNKTQSPKSDSFGSKERSVALSSSIKTTSRCQGNWSVRMSLGLAFHWIRESHPRRTRQETTWAVHAVGGNSYNQQTAV